MEARVKWAGDLDAVAGKIAAWSHVGASHLSVDTMGSGLARVDDHLEVLTRVAETL
jgi:hypothetical protein